VQGLLADNNIEGHLVRLGHLLEGLDLWGLLVELNLDFATFHDLGIPQGIDDRTLWTFCQQSGWVLLTDNRTRAGGDSLQQTLADSWRDGQLPVLTPSDKHRLERDPEYANRVAEDVAEVLFGIKNGEYCNQPRIYVPLWARRSQAAE
jgi:hypothetical protein